MPLDVQCKEFKLIADNVKSGLVIYEVYNEGEDFIFRYINKAVLKIEKLKKKDLLDKKVTEVFPAVKKFGLFAVLKEVWRSGKAQNFPMRMYSDNRIQGWRDNFIFKLDDSHLVALYDDLTSQKKYEEELYHNQQKYKTFLENASDIVLVHTTDGTLIEVNHVALKKLDYSRKELLTINMKQIAPNFQTLSNVKDLSTGDKPLGFESQLKKSDGTLFPVEAHVKKFQLENKEYIFATVRDLTEKKFIEKSLRESRQQYELAVKGSRDGIWDWNVETNELYLSPRWKEMLGYKDRELENRFSTFLKLLHPDDKKQLLVDIDDYFAGRLQVWEQEVRLQHKNGSYRWILAKGEALRNEKGIAYRMAGSHSDITERKLAENKIIESENQFREAFETSAIGMAIVSLEGEWIKTNSSISSMLGYTENELRRKTFQEITHPDDLDLDLKHVKNTIEGKIRSYQLEKRYLHKNGRYIWGLLSVSLVRDSQGQPLHFVSQIVDLSKQKKAQEDLEQAVITDPLTGVYNRHYLNQEILRQVELCRRHRDKIAVAIIDLDYFKNINDTYGHLAGDFVLQNVASDLNKAIRNIDTLCRYGGEEFVIIFPRTNDENSCIVSERIRSAIGEKKYKFNQNTISLTISIGLTMLHEEDTAEKLLERADMALYQAKHSGRNRVVCFE